MVWETFSDSVSPGSNPGSPANKIKGLPMRKLGNPGTNSAYRTHKGRHTSDILGEIDDSPGRRKRFWALVEKRGPDECWPWKGYVDRDGYGAWKMGRWARLRAHRVAFALTTNIEPVTGVVCHSCDNPICCNPRHLWLGTPADNYRDMVSKGRVSDAYLKTST